MEVRAVCYHVMRVSNLPCLGNSGSPVLRQHDLVSIGAHVYGGALNSASVIGKYGNPYQDYLAAFSLSLLDKALNLVPVTGNTSICAPVPSGYGSAIPSKMTVSGPTPSSLRQPTLQGPYTPQPANRAQHQRHSSMTKVIQNGSYAPGKNLNGGHRVTESSEEGFMDVLKTVACALPAGLGLAGGPIGALAGFALSTASKIAAEPTDAESTIEGPVVPEGAMERAILAEATLSALQSGELHPDLEESIFSDMKDTVIKALPTIRKAAP